MKLNRLTLFFLINISGMLFGKNLSILSSGSINNIELLDVYLHEYNGHSIAIIPGGLGGTNFVDVSDPTDLQVFGSYTAQYCDFGRLYAWSAKMNVAYGAGRDCGIHVVDISNLEQPVLINTIQDNTYEDNVRYEHTSVRNNLMFAARHQFGIEIFNIDNPEEPQRIVSYPTDNAWATIAIGPYLYVADGAFGIKVLEISIPILPSVVAEISTSGTAKDVDIFGNYLFVAVGAAGVDMFDITNPENPVFVDNYNTTGYASRVSVNESIVAVSDWDDVEVLSFSVDGLELTGYKNTGGRVMALAMSGNTIFSAEWMEMTVFEYGPVQGPDIDFSKRKIEFPRVNQGNNHSEFFLLENNGPSQLNINGININSSDFLINYDNVVLPAYTSQQVEVIYTPQGNPWSTYVEFFTNDLDESYNQLWFTGNYPYGPMPGDPAPDFTLPIVNGSGDLSLSDLSGDPVVIAFFTAW